MGGPETRKVTDLSTESDQVDILAAIEDLKTMIVLAEGNNVIGIIKIGDGTDTLDLLSMEGIISLRTITGLNDDFHISLRANNISATTGYILIDLSDTVVFPHTNTDHIVLTFMSVSLNPGSGFAGDVCIGYISRIDGTNSDIRILREFHMDRAEGNINLFEEYNSAHFGTKPDRALLDELTNQSSFNTGNTNTIPGGGTATPAVGDLVMLLTRASGAIDIGISIGYRTLAE